MLTSSTSLAQGRFSLTRPLGEGGMAQVWEGYDHTLQVWRALKFVHPQLAKRPAILRRFTAEAHAMARLEHPNVVRIYDVGERDDGTPYLVMELANGGSIEGYLERYGKMDARLAVRVILDVCSGVQAAHDEGIVHRDLKPDNLLIDRRGTCKVTDFGIAQLQTTDNRTKTGSVMGTLAYMAPEQRADAKHIGPTADVYALAATLFAMITGEVPNELFMSQHHEDMLDGIPQVLREPLLHALRYDPTERTPTMTAFADAVRQVQDQLPESPQNVPALVTTSDTSPRIPDQPRESATDVGEPTLLPEEAGVVRNTPNTLEPDQVAALMPEMLGELAADLQSETERLAAEQRKAAARARLEAIQARKSQPPEESNATASQPTAPTKRSAVDDEDVEKVERHKAKASGDGPWAMVIAAFDLVWRLISGPGKPIAIVFALTVFPMTLIMANTASSINSAAAATRTAATAFLQAVSSDDQLANDLDAAGLDTSRARVTRARMSGVGEQAQLELAETYVSQMRGIVVKGSRYSSAETADQLAAANRRMATLESLMNSYRAARDEWNASAGSASGRSACAAGFADCPE